MRRLGILIALLASLAVAVPAANANHPLTQREAAKEFKSYAVNHYDVDYFDQQPSCYRFSRYLFRCVALVVYFDGEYACARGPVHATGPYHHTIRVNIWLCRG